MGFYDTPLRARLNAEGYKKVFSLSQKGNQSYYIGMAAVHMDCGLPYAAIPWGTSGLDVPLSPDIRAEDIDAYELKPDMIKPELKVGNYVLRNRSGHVLATALVVNHPGGSRLTVIGKNRGDVIKFYDQICADETLPENAGGRNHLIRSLRDVNHSLVSQCRTYMEQILLSKKSSLDALREKSKLEAEVTRLTDEVARLKSERQPKQGWWNPLSGSRTNRHAA